MMAAAITTAMGIRTTLVFDSETYIQRNRTRDKLTDRGCQIDREWEASKTPPDAGADTPLVVLMQAGVHERDFSRWKAYADRGGARFFSLPHQVSNHAWRLLEEWLSRAMVSPVGVSSSTDELEAKLHRSLADLKDRDVDLRKANEMIASLRKELDEAAATTVDGAALAAKVKGLERMIVESNRERDGLREQLDAATKRANAAAKTLAEHTSKWNTEREELVAAKEAAETAAPAPSSQVIAAGIDPAIILAFSKMIDIGEMTFEQAWTRVCARAGKASQ